MEDAECVLAVNQLDALSWPLSGPSWWLGLHFSVSIRSALSLCWPRRAPSSNPSRQSTLGSRWPGRSSSGHQALSSVPSLRSAKSPSGAYSADSGTFRHSWAGLAVSQSMLGLRHRLRRVMPSARWGRTGLRLRPRLALSCLSSGRTPCQPHRASLSVLSLPGHSSFVLWLHFLKDSDATASGI